MAENKDNNVNNKTDNEIEKESEEVKLPEVYKITPELLLNANTYVPIMAKAGFANLIATKCFERVSVSASEKESVIALPDMYKENTSKKSRYMMGALAAMYFGVAFEYEGDDKMLMSIDEYDKWAGGHILNQLERYKSDMKIKDICFDILQDYRDLEKKVNTEIYALLQIANEPIGRMMASLQLAVTPESTQELLKQLQSVQKEMEDYKASKGIEDKENE